MQLAGTSTSQAISEPASLKILLLIDGMAALTDGGTERQLLQLAAVARGAGLVPTICVLRDTRWLTPAVAGCSVRWCSFQSLRSAPSLMELLRLVLWMRRERFAILQTFFTDANLLGPLLGRCANIPVIFGTRRSLNPVGFLTSLIVRVLARLSARAVTRVLTNAEAVSRDMEATEGFPPWKLSVIYNGVDIAALQAPDTLGANVRNSLHLTPGQLLIGNISGLRPVKRLDVFLEACALAHARAPHLRFVIVGEGEERSTLEALISKLGLEGTATLAGAQEDVRPWLAAMDVAVLCSEAEGFSNSLLEYMAVGLPVVASDVGGNREALGDCGLLVPSANPCALGNALLHFTGMEARREYGARARLRVERFSLENAQTRMAALYREHCPALAAQGGEAVQASAQSSSQPLALSRTDAQLHHGATVNLPRSEFRLRRGAPQTEDHLHTPLLSRTGAGD